MQLAVSIFKNFFLRSRSIIITFPCIYLMSFERTLLHRNGDINSNYVEDDASWGHKPHCIICSAKIIWQYRSEKKLFLLFVDRSNIIG